jgi:hypothetical protein
MNAGVWIDHHKAVVVLLTEQGQEMLKIQSGDRASARSPAGLRAKNGQAANDFATEGNRGQQVTIHRNQYYDEVIACVRNAQAILILGPGEAKGEFRRRMVREKFGGHVAEMKTVPGLKDEQIADYVRQHFQ